MRKFRIFLLYWLPVLVWMFTIFTASGDSASFKHSSRIIGPLLHWLFPDISDERSDLIVTFFRKCAHLTEYAILSLLFLRARRQVGWGRRKPWRWILAAEALWFAAFYASTDEFHQTFVASRDGCVRDVMIDSSGALIGLMVFLGLGALAQDLVMRRPLILVLTLYAAGILVAELPVPLLPLFCVAFVIAGLFPFFRSLRKTLLCLLIFLCGWINTARRTAIISPYDLRNLSGDAAQIITVRGTLLETPRARSFELKDRELWSSSARLAVDSACWRNGNWQPARGTVLCSVAQRLPETFFAGQTVEISGVIQPPKSALAEGLFDHRKFLESQGIYRQLASRQISEWSIRSSPSRPPLADRFSAWARKAIALGKPAEDETLRLEWALTLGWKAEITDEVMDPFVRASTYHIFAVDGLRIAIVSGILFFLLRKFRLSRVWCGIIAMPFLCFYAAMTGWPASAIRAIIMIFVIYGGWVLQRPSDLLNSLFAAALIILVWEPRQIFQAGFQLSFAVVLCLILMLPGLEIMCNFLTRTDPLRPESLQSRGQKTMLIAWRWWVNLFLVSIAAWLASLPLVAYYFHVFTPVSGAANLVAVPLCVLVLIFNLTSLLLAAWFPLAAIPLNYAGWSCMKLIQFTSVWFAHQPKACLNVPLPGLFTIGLYYLVLIVVVTGWLWQIEWRKTKLAVLSLLVAIWFGLWLHNLPVTRITVLPLQNGHAVYVSEKTFGNDWLIDCGNEGNANRIVKPFLESQGVNRLANLVLTHGEANYTGGAQFVARLFEPRHVYTSAINFRSPTYRAFRAGLVQPSKSPIIWEAGVKAGPWQILYPTPQIHLPKSSDNSLVLRGEFHGLRVLLFSNLGREGQNALLDSDHELRADLVIAGASPPDEPLADPLLDAIRPKIVVIADTLKVITEHERETLAKRLQKHQAQFFYTSECDAVTLEIRRKRWELRTMNGIKISGPNPTARN